MEGFSTDQSAWSLLAAWFGCTTWHIVLAAISGVAGPKTWFQSCIDLIRALFKMSSAWISTNQFLAKKQSMENKYSTCANHCASLMAYPWLSIRNCGLHFCPEKRRFWKWWRHQSAEQARFKKRGGGKDEMAGCNKPIHIWYVMLFLYDTLCIIM